MTFTKPPFPRLQRGKFVSDGLVAAYPFYEGSGNKLHDVSGNRNHGTLNGPTWVGGRYGHALDFDGVNDYVNVGDFPAVDALRTRIAVCARITPTNLTGRHDFVSKYDAGAGERAILFYLNGSTPRWTVQENAGSYSASSDIASSQTLSIGKTYHVVGTFHGNKEMKIYVDGVERASLASGSVPTDFSPTAADFLIGAPGDISNVFQGQIDDVRIYSRALSPSEIKLIAAGLG